MLQLPDAERRLLLRWARQAILEAVTYGRLMDFPVLSDPLVVKCGVFVTLYCNSRLRGCVGQPEPVDPLAHAVIRCAVAAALEDPRFQPLTLGETPGLCLEISVLSPFRLVDRNHLEDVTIGLHGLHIAACGRKGLLLPQVAAERSWNVVRFLEETCAKGGLERSAWRAQETMIHCFTTERFSEDDFADITFPGFASKGEAPQALPAGPNKRK